MKYISHIKELVSGIIDNETVTRDTEAYNALTALKNHLETLEEVQKYMPYKDPGPVIQKLEQSLTQANTKNQELKKQILYFDEELEKKNKSRDQCYQYWQEYKSKYETLEQKNRDNNKELEQFQSQIKDLNEELAKKNTYIEDLKKQTETSSQKQEEISFLVGILTEEQLGEYQEYLRTQLPDDQPNYGPQHIISRSKKRR